MEQQLFTFLDHIQNNKHSDNTIDAYGSDIYQLLQFLQDESGHDVTDWSDVSQEMLSEYVEYMKQNAYTASTITRKMAAINSFFDFLLYKRYIRNNVTADVKYQRAKRRPLTTVSVGNVAQLLKEINQGESPSHLRDAAIVLLLYKTGMQATEIIDLQINDVDINKRTIYCRGKNQRTLEIDGNTADVLSDYLNNGRPCFVKDENEKALFISRIGKKLSRQSIWNVVKSHTQFANLDDNITPRSLGNCIKENRRVNKTKT